MTAGQSAWREKLRALVEHPRSQRIIMTLIVINAVVLGLETSATAREAAGELLRVLDSLILAVFVLELGAKILVHGRRFVRDPWNIFDFLVVAVALVPATGNLSVLRALRVLRVMRLVSGIPSMRRVVGALLSAIPGMGSIVALLALVYYVFAVIATRLYGASFPEWFGTIGASSYSLFQIMTLESWSMGIVRPVMETYPIAWLFFVPFIMLTSFTVLNLFIGIIVDAMQSQHQSEVEAEREQAHADAEAILAELRSLRQEVTEMRQERRSEDQGQ
ncbi:ion transporter [Aquibaculum arenosum]|uniref:Ion transporter n=1 Tax=Aquibaculum arenosum TaxID=3032591 RepID=A0ABT5YLS9_9PROT|nr:ion transporter [Fodinicurvata sp. CAU 1616]MDF2095884.1 ion transporter [Fodinicurvata sp. CAU 1616]